MARRLSIRQATAPYFKPWVLIDEDTKECIGHFKTRTEAQEGMRVIGEKDVEASNIQPVRNPLKALDIRMKHPAGGRPPVQEPKPEPQPHGLVRRKVVL